jgi:hypothetical protein
MAMSMRSRREEGRAGLWMTAMVLCAAAAEIRAPDAIVRLDDRRQFTMSDCSKALSIMP